MIYDVLIVGAGVTGGMLARELSRSKVSVCLLEKENDVAMGASRPIPESFTAVMTRYREP